MANQNCANCQVELTGEPLEGFCPRCLAGVAFGGAVDTPTEAGSVAATALGDYELLEVIGSGGMGVVWRARQRRLRRLVAVKVIRQGPFADEREVARFQREASAAAALSHPNIVAIHEIGYEGGHHYFSMDLVEGPTLAALVGAGPLEPARAARYAVALAAALESAHACGTIHRDLKPSNVLIDAQDRPRLTDFGLAKQLDSTELTLTREVLGSPGYMSPEQADPARGEATASSDLYALGALLYHLLTGRPPFAAATVTATLAQVLTEDPVPVRRLNSSVPPDLETICLKCLRKEPAQRYPGAAELRGDLESFLASKPIRARPPSALERLWLWRKRKPALAAALALISILLVAGVAGVLWQAGRARHAATEARLHSYAADLGAAAGARRAGDWGLAREILSRYTSGPLASERGFEWFHLWRESRGQSARTLVMSNGGIRQVGFSADGRWLLAQGAKALEVWDTAEWRSGWRWLVPQGNGAGFLVGTSRVTVLGAQGFHQLRLEDGADEGAIPAGARDSFHQLFRVGGGWVVAEHNQTRRWADAGGDATLLKGGTAPGAMTRDGTVLALNHGTQVGLWSVKSWDLLHRVPLGDAGSLHVAPALAFSPDGILLAAGTRQGVVQIVNWREERVVARFTNAPSQIVFSLAFSPDGRWLLVGSGDQSIQRWRTSDWSRGEPWRGHGNEVWSLAFSPDGRWLASGDKDGVVQLWPAEPVAPANWFKPSHDLEGWALLNAEEWIVFETEASGLTWHRRRYGQPEDRASGRLDHCRLFWVSRDARHIAQVRRDGDLVLAGFDPETVRARVPAGQVGDVRKMSFAADQRTLLTQRRDGVMTWWATPRLEKLHERALPGRLAFATREVFGTFATNRAAAIHLWRADDGRLIRTLSGHSLGLGTPETSRDGRWLATTSEDGTVRVWSLPSGEPRYVLRAQKQGVFACDISPDLRTLAAGGQDGTVTLWHLPTGRHLALLDAEMPGRYVAWLRFIEDGAVLVAEMDDGTLRFWRGPKDFL